MGPVDPKAIDQALRAFASRNYDECVRQALVLLRTRKTHELLQALLISLQRLGRTDLLEELRASVLKVTHPWASTLLKLTLGEAEPAEVLGQAEDDVQRCQAHYYTGARLLTLGLAEAASAEFVASMATGARCLECQLARIEVASAPPDP
jgi:hypothetical protein